MNENKGKLFIEKRKHRRIYKQYDVRYKLMPKEATTKAPKIEGKSLDISVGGIRIEGDVLGNEGEIIRVEIDTGTGSGEFIVVFAEIRWIRRESAGGKSGQLGLQFLALKQEDVETIKKIVAENSQE